jgi:transcriptional regulator with XRE-family HTH domain
MFIESSLGEVIAKRRNELNLTQRTISIKLDVTTQHISNIETGRTVPSDDFCLQLAKMLKLDPEFLILSAHREKASKRAKAFFTNAMVCRERKLGKSKISLAS